MNKRNFGYAFLLSLLLINITACEPEENEEPVLDEPVTFSLGFENLELMLEDSFQLVLQVTPDTTTVKDLIWTSSNDTIISVSSTGKIKAKTIGSANIKVSSAIHEVQANISVRVIPIPLQSISFNQAIIPAYINEPISLYQYLQFQPLNATFKKINWQSSNYSKVHIDTNGIATAKQLGFVFVSALSDINSSVFADQHIIPAHRGQLVAAFLTTTSNFFDQKYYGEVYIGALENTVVISEVTLFLKRKDDPDKVALKSVNPNLTLEPGQAQKIGMEITAEQLSDLSYGRHARLSVSVQGKEYYVYLGWDDEKIESMEK